MDEAVSLENENLERLKDRSDLSTSSVSVECGRESLGILPPNFDRESMAFCSTLFLDDHDSLGFSSFFQTSVTDGESLANGRESLGILHHSTLDPMYGMQNSKTPDILLTTICESGHESVCDIFNKAFLIPNSRKNSVLSSCSHLSFNANSIEEPSKIFSIHSPSDNFFSNSLTDSVFITTNDINASIPYGGQKRLRLHSMPTTLNSYSNIEWNLFLERNYDSHRRKLSLQSNVHSITSILNEAKFISPRDIDSQIAFKTPLRNVSNDISWNNGKVTDNSHSGQKTEDMDLNTEKGNILHDSIFIEGEYIAHKMANGSILNDSYENEVGVLDNVPHPDWPEVPVSPEKDLNLHANMIKPESTEEVQTASETDIKQLITPKTNQIPKSAKELLNNLSEILNNTTRSDQQRSEGQYLLNSLAELLSDGSNDGSAHLDDSGHSSFIESCSVENLPKPKVKSKLVDRLSLSFNSDLPGKFKQPKFIKKASFSKLNMDDSKNKTGSSISSGKSENLSGNILLLSSRNNMKVKSNNEVAKKGPLKAIIPVKELKKIAKTVTPAKTDKRTATMMQSKRTSTPLNEPRLKPVAASTPTPRPLLKTESNARKSLPSNLKTGAISKNSAIKSQQESNLGIKSRRTLPLSNILSKEKPTTTSKLLNASQDYGKRRNSISVFKKEQLPGRPRSNSLPKEPVGIMSSMSKIRENLLNSPEYKSLTNKSLLKEKNTSGSSSLSMPKYKKPGKENVK